MSETAKEKAPAKPKDVAGRALIDIPEHGLKCGEFGALPEAAAKAFIESGAFDPKAVKR